MCSVMMALDLDTDTLFVDSFPPSAAYMRR